MDDRRSFKRLPAETEIRLRLLDDSTTSKASGKNLSGGGLQFFSNEPLRIGALAEVEVLQPGGSTRLPSLRAVIRIVRIEGTLPPYEVAAEFVEIR
jgi:hypothetical protein